MCGALGTCRGRPRVAGTAGPCSRLGQEGMLHRSWAQDGAGLGQRRCTQTCSRRGRIRAGGFLCLFGLWGPSPGPRTVNIIEDETRSRPQGMGRDSRRPRIENIGTSH
eukprot:5949057-Pyramimonas_sp.AAC.1